MTALPDPPRVSVSREGRIAHVRLERPDKRNAMDMAMFDALIAAGEGLSRDVGLAAVILSGEGESFCAGVDTSEFMAMAARIDATRVEMLAPEPGTANRFQRPCTVWAEVPAPVIAAIHGHCYGAGLQLALGADIRIAAPDARFSIMETRWGLVPDMGLSQSLPRLMRADRALDLILTAEVISATEAHAAGLVTYLADDPLAAAQALGARYATRSAQTLASAKRLVQGIWRAEGSSGLRIEAELQAALIGTPDQLEATIAGLEGRTPRFASDGS